MLENTPQSRKHVGESARGMRLDHNDLVEFAERLGRLEKDRKPYNLETISPSTVESTPAFDGNVILHFDGRSGVHINSISQFAGVENEVLFGTKTNFCIADIQVSEGYKKVYVYLEERP